MKITILKPDGKTMEVNNVAAVFCEAARLEMRDKIAADEYSEDERKSQWIIKDPNLPMDTGPEGVYGARA